MLYVRIGPTPCVSTSQPSSVSMGEPQLPSWIISHDRRGPWNDLAVPHRRGWSENAMALLSPSQRDRAAYLPSMRRGKSASPLFAAAGPRTGDAEKSTKFVVSRSCWLTDVPSYAVYVA